ncbi:MAG: hypothetical protein J0H99_00525 [Rhodospirillales bacterium]|nr:hypothetical protein [Rhodospirillales bacterium]
MREALDEFRVAQLREVQPGGDRLGLRVQREMDRDTPDFDFLISINESFVAGLTD